MKIEIYASVKAESPAPGPYKKIDIVGRDLPYQVGDITHYGEVILIMPPDILAGALTIDNFDIGLISILQTEGRRM